MIERIAFSGQPAWATHHRHAAKLAEVRSHRARLANVRWVWRQIVEIDLHVTRNKKIQAAIAIVIAPARACAPAFARDAYYFRNIGERAVAIVAIQTRDAEVADKQIGAAIIVVITNCNAHSPTLVRDSGFVSNIFKLPVTEISIERGAGCFFLASYRRHRRSVYEVDVRTSIGVVIKDRHAT